MDEDAAIAKAIQKKGTDLFFCEKNKSVPFFYGGHWAQMLVNRFVER
jgi:hypothetical protein